MKAVKTSIEGVLIIEPETFSDERGFFMETWNIAPFCSQNMEHCSVLLSEHATL